MALSAGDPSVPKALAAPGTFHGLARSGRPSVILLDCALRSPSGAET